MLIYGTLNTHNAIYDMTRCELHFVQRSLFDMIMAVRDVGRDVGRDAVRRIYTTLSTHYQPSGNGATFHIYNAANARASHPRHPRHPGHSRVELLVKVSSSSVQLPLVSNPITSRPNSVVGRESVMQVWNVLEHVRWPER